MMTLRYGWRYVRRHGPMAAVRSAVNRYVYRSHRLVIIHGPLDGPPVEDHVGNIVFRCATTSDLGRLAELERYGRGSNLRACVMEDGDWLFVACDGDRVVATRLYSRVLPPYSLVPRVLELEPTQVWMGDLFSLPEYRSQGIGRRLALFADRCMASRGYREMFASIAVNNMPSLRLSSHKGSQPFCYVSYFRFLCYERLRVTKDRPTEFENAEPHR